MTDLEIPLEKDRKGHYRFFEILPGSLSWLLLLTPLILSFISITAAVIFVLAYLLIYFIRSLGYDVRAISGYITMKQQLKIDWNELLDDLNNDSIPPNAKRPKWHYKNLERRRTFERIYKPSEMVHAVILATVNESKEILEPTLESIISSTYDSHKIILIFAYEGRAGEVTKERVLSLAKKYRSHFRDVLAFQHPNNIPNEVIGKGGNITYAGRHLADYVKEHNIPADQVLVTTLDSDSRPNKLYFSALTYLFCIVPKPLRASYQPLPMFTNNIWDAPTMMRVIATGNNLFYIVLTKRPHMERNFSSHAQSLQALIDIDFWSTRTVVEDGHQFWRSYFRYDGDYRVYPLSIPIYQDAVLADGYLKTIKAQFIQLRRWTYGASDIAYIADKAFFHKNKVPKKDAIGKFFRALEGHVTWATGTALVFGAAFIPAFFHPQSFAAHELPHIVSRIQEIGIIGLLASMYVCLVTLPPRPARYKRHRSVLMVLQWALAPVVAICFSSLAALNSQTRLMFKKYLSRFDVTEKAVVTHSGNIISTKADPTV
jgi:cellulose synthase/poly-beta-1,6-N-acetylglucosamine synthase-like glycosyltransferase